MFQRNVDTSSLTTVIDVVITPGTSVIPHFLWQEKPVILLDDWARMTIPLHTINFITTGRTFQK